VTVTKRHNRHSTGEREALAEGSAASAPKRDDYRGKASGCDRGSYLIRRSISAWVAFVRFVPNSDRSADVAAGPSRADIVAKVTAGKL
jgi:hypothetical protein